MTNVKVLQGFHNNKKVEKHWFRDLAKLVDISGTFLASCAHCERGFSLMNSMKTKLRNRLGKGHLDMIVRVKSYPQDGCVIDKVKFFEEWINSKDRHEKIKI